MAGANLMISHLCYETETLNKIKEICKGKKELLIVTLPNLLEKLFFVYQDNAFENINLFCKEHNYSYSVVDGPVISKVTIKRN